MIDKTVDLTTLLKLKPDWTHTHTLPKKSGLVSTFKAEYKSDWMYAVDVAAAEVLL